MLKAKSETQNLLPQLYVYVETQFNKKIRCIRTDNGTEFLLKEFFKTKGIIHQLSCVETPQQNSIVERKHQHILNVARALKFQSNIPLRFWGHCVLTTVCLINRLPNSAINNKTPYEVLFGKLPTFSHLKVFGCLCYASTLAHNRHKFLPRATKYVFLGYPFGVKGYKVMDLTTHSVFISRDVHFHESLFPFQSSDLPQYLDPFDSSTLSSSISLNLLSLPTVSNDSVMPDFPDSAANTSIAAECVPLDCSIVPFSSSLLASDTLNVTALPHASSPQIRKSTRIYRLPTYLQDYSCSLLTTKPSSSSPYDINDHLSYANLSSSYQVFALATSAEVEPEYYHQAVLSKAWQGAMDKEIGALELNHTWDVVPLPHGKFPTGCKWVYRIKYNPDGSVER